MIAAVPSSRPNIRGCNADIHQFIVGVGYEQPMLQRLAWQCGAAATSRSAAAWRTTSSRRHILRAVSSSPRPGRELEHGHAGSDSMLQNPY
jgi:hypothetical protein